jgi:hypothetical protein
MEPYFNYDFGRVRVHTDSEAAASAQEIAALAYTVGQNIVFGAGQYAPRTSRGRHLLAHELAHTIQQSHLPEQAADLPISARNDRLETEAETAAHSVEPAENGRTNATARVPQLQAEASPVVRRQPVSGKDEHGLPPIQTLPKKEEVTPGTDEKSPEPECKGTSDVPLPCTPQPLSFDEFQKTGPQEAFGHTTYSPQQIPVPEVLTEPVKGGKVVLKMTQAKQVACESAYVKANTKPFWRTISIDEADPHQKGLAEQCKGNSYTRQFVITPDGEKKLQEAELEHCTDYKYAFDHSIGCYASVVNELARKKTQFASEQDAVKEVTARTGREPSTWMDRYFELLAKSALRDTNKWHTAIDPPGPGLEIEVQKSGRCQARGVGEINAKSYPQVGKHSTADLIK